MKERIDAAPGVEFFNVSGAGIMHHPRVVQAAPETAFGGLAALDAVAVEQAFRAAHRRGGDSSGRLLGEIDALLRREHASSPFADWIEQLFQEGITAGCSVSPALFCPRPDPNNPIPDNGLSTNAQMAVFLVRAFHLAYVP